MINLRGRRLPRPSYLYVWYLKSDEIICFTLLYPRILDPDMKIVLHQLMLQNIYVYIVKLMSAENKILQIWYEWFVVLFWFISSMIDNMQCYARTIPMETSLISVWITKSPQCHWWWYCQYPLLAAMHPGSSFPTW